MKNKPMSCFLSPYNTVSMVKYLALCNVNETECFRLFWVLLDIAEGNITQNSVHSRSKYVVVRMDTATSFIRSPNSVQEKIFNGLD